MTMQVPVLKTLTGFVNKSTFVDFFGYLAKFLSGSHIDPDSTILWQYKMEAKFLQILPHSGA